MLLGQEQKLQEQLERVRQGQVRQGQVRQGQVRLMVAEAELLPVLLEPPEQVQESQVLREQVRLVRLVVAEAEQLLVRLAQQGQKLEDQLAQEVAAALSTEQELQALGPLAMAAAGQRNCHCRAKSCLQVVKEE
ncbi:hypothetical protein LPJ69_000341 [Coemansia sp. RSA 1752]|nr:hypothetical protein LPJ69_000341 [Coemansia sp. RSA 1752]KAJ1795013.1 hypothetical protein LPJ67_000314 [Coemansia sp. RSA 1938]